jgi:hypothetical protein
LKELYGELLNPLGNNFLNIAPTFQP